MDRCPKEKTKNRKPYSMLSHSFIGSFFQHLLTIPFSPYVLVSMEAQNREKFKNLVLIIGHIFPRNLFKNSEVSNSCPKWQLIILQNQISKAHN